MYFLKKSNIYKEYILHRRLFTSTVFRFVLLALCIFYVNTFIAYEVKAQTTPTTSPSFSKQTSFKGWIIDLKKAASTFKSSQHIWIEDLDTNALLITIYPKQLDVEVLNWVGKGGKLFVALNRESVAGADTFLKALDLKVIVPQQMNQPMDQIKGAWPFPKQSVQNSKFTNYLLTPWLTINPLTFREGVSWFKGAIPPIAIDEYGHSIAYRVRYGKGILTLFGDADALSDRLSVLPENRRFSQAILWWITHPYPSSPQDSTSIRSKSSININFIQPTGKVASKMNEERLNYRLNEFYKQIEQWWNEHPIWDFNVYTHIKYLVISLCLAYIIILLWLNESPSWRSLFILRKK